jgi:hypothetical protein
VANEYGSLEELKEMRSISADVTSQDQALLRALTRASRAIDRRCGRFFYRTGAPVARSFSPRGRTISFLGSETLLVDDIADESSVSISIGGVTADPSGISYTPRAAGQPVTGIIRSSWYGGALLITAEWGWPEVPDEIQQATLLLANRRYMRKDSPEGTSGWSQEGQISVSRYDSDVEDLVAPFVLEGFGA